MSQNIASNPNHAQWIEVLRSGVPIGVFTFLGVDSMLQSDLWISSVEGSMFHPSPCLRNQKIHHLTILEGCWFCQYSQIALKPLRILLF